MGVSDVQQKVISRRELLVSGAAMAVGMAAAAVNPPMAAATNLDPVLVGQGYSSTAATSIYRYDTLPGGQIMTYADLGFQGATYEGVRGYARGVATPGSSGVHGLAQNTNATGVLAENYTPAGTALDVRGVARFARAGTGYVAKKSSSVSVTPPGGVATGALVLVTLQNSPGGVYLKCAKRISATRFVVYLSKKATARTYFSWFVIG